MLWNEGNQLYIHEQLSTNLTHRGRDPEQAERQMESKLTEDVVFA